jgi:hypothetical protein
MSSALPALMEVNSTPGLDPVNEHDPVIGLKNKFRGTFKGTVPETWACIDITVRVARQLNERPRETLQFETPVERFNACVASIG